MYQLVITTKPKRDWKTLWLMYSEEEYIITTNNETELSDVMKMINEFEKFNCTVKVNEIG